jgi:hypothetical protein
MAFLPAAAAKGDHGLPGDRGLARKFPNPGRGFLAADNTEAGRYILVAYDGDGIGLATGKAASSAVGAGQDSRDLFDQGVFFHPEQAGGHGQEDGSRGANAEKRESGCCQHDGILSVSYL